MPAPECSARCTLCVAPGFTITALYGAVSRSETRAKATLAMVLADMVLADRLFHDGHPDIHVIDPDGFRYERETFRKTLPLVKRPGLQSSPSCPRVT